LLRLRAFGTLTQWVDKSINVNIENGKIKVERESDDKDIRSKHGLYRMLIANMIKGVTKGYEKSLIINGVGYKAQKQGNKLVLNIAFFPQCRVFQPQGIT
jgi:large subunit ribosomal protein L6